MAELVFGKAFHMLDSADNRFIIDLIQIAAFRVGVCLQLPQLATLNLDKIFIPHVRKLRDDYVKVSKDMAIERMKMDSTRQDLFSHILAAKDPETGKGFSMDEIWGESTLLIIAGTTSSDRAFTTSLKGHRFGCNIYCDGKLFLLHGAPSGSVLEDLRRGSTSILLRRRNTKWSKAQFVHLFTSFH